MQAELDYKKSTDILWSSCKEKQYMKLLIEQSLDCKETEIKITCGLMDDRLRHLVEQIKLFSFSITAEKDGISIPVALEDIYYFETIENKTFLYTEKEVCQCSKKLYELEVYLENTTFIRISKNSILNTAMVVSVRAQFGGRLEANLKNNEKVLISKHYMKEFRNKFLQKGG